ncbi:MAG: C-terminal helicase domain-containing protein [Bacteroidales bacterium]
MKVEDIHSDLDQPARERVLMAFKNRDLNILVATDILSRGIDVEDIELIINYDVPNDGEDYIHRIGRTARAEAEGIAITLINEKEQYQFQQIEEMLEKPVHKGKIPEELGNGPEYKLQQRKQRPFGKGRKFRTQKFKGKRNNQ